MKKLRTPFMIAVIVFGFILSNATLQCSIRCSVPATPALERLLEQQILNQELGDPARAQLYNYKLFCLMLQAFIPAPVENWTLNFSSWRTKQGLFLVDSTHLYTPWGEVSLPAKINPRTKIATSRQKTVKHCDLSTAHRLVAELFMDLKSNATEDFGRTRTLASVDAINEDRLPDAILADDSDKITFEEREIAWKILNACFEEKQALKQETKFALDEDQSLFLLI
jgi:hypothetical protein